MATPFDLMPAIDLRGGRVVRLVEGDFDRETTYPGNPAEVAGSFASAGAERIHVVDLDGARGGRFTQLAAVESIVIAVGEQVVVEVAGGLRTAGDVAAAFACGAARIVIGTAALRDPSFARGCVDTHGAARVVAAIDVRDGLAVGQGWARRAPGVDPVDAIARLADEGISIFECTAIERDGGLAGPDLQLLARLVALGRGSIVASGGISTLADIRAVRDAGCVGAIVGRALYEGRFDLAHALRTSAR